MAKGYWVSCYRAINDADALAEYAKLAAPAIENGGGKFLARGGRLEAFEAGTKGAHCHRGVSKLRTGPGDP